MFSTGGTPASAADQLVRPACRVHVTGRVTLESPMRLVRESDFPSRQARLAFVFLCLQRRRPVACERLVDALWAEGEPPAAWETAVCSIVSKVRRVVQAMVGSEGDLVRRFGSIQLVLPPTAWVDIEVAGAAIDEAEGHVRAGRSAAAWPAANIAICIAREPLLADEMAPWLEARRAALREILMRALRCLSDTSLANGEAPLARQYAQEALDCDPLSETSVRHLMRTHVALGSRADALRAHALLRQRLRDELGTSPSPQTEALFLQILRA